MHNQRIERLWRDVHKEVTQPIYAELYRLEDEQALDVDLPLHRLIVQTLYLPVIQNNLDRFRLAWNAHQVRTERQRTPVQIWREGMLANQHSGLTGPEEVFSEERRSLRQRVLDRVGEVPDVVIDEATRPSLDNEQINILNQLLLRPGDVSTADLFKEAVNLLM